MQLQSGRANRYLVAFLMASCLFGGLFPFLNIDLRVVILTPVRTSVLLVSLYCLVVWAKRLVKGDLWSALKKRKTECLVFLYFVLWSIWTIAWLVFGSTNAAAPTEAMAILVNCMFAFCMFTLVETKQDVSFLLKASVLFGLVLATMAMVEVVTGSFVPNTRYYLSLEQRVELGKTLFSPTTVFYNPNDYAAFMLLCISIACFWIVRSQSYWEFLRNLAIVGALTVSPMLVNSTLFNLTALLLVTLTAVGILCVRLNNLKTRIVKTIVFLLVVVVFSLTVSKVIRPSVAHLNKVYFAERIRTEYVPEETVSESKNTEATELQNQNASEDPTSVQEEKPVETKPTDQAVASDVEKPDSLLHQIERARYGLGTIHTRLSLIKAGLEFFADAPFVGCGPASYQDKAASREDILEQTGGIVDPHCFYIELLAQYGIVLFAVYMLIVLYLAVVSLVEVFKEMKSGKPARGFLCLSMLGAFSVAVIMPSTAIRHTALWMMFLLLVSAFSKMQIQEND